MVWASDERVCIPVDHRVIEVPKDRERQIYVWNQGYGTDEVRSLLAENGFSKVEHFADVAGKTYREDSKVIAAIAAR